MNIVRTTIVASCIAVSLCVGLFGMQFPVVQAHDDGTDHAHPSPSTVPVDTIFVKPQSTERVTTLLKLYQDQVEQYRTLDREYRVNTAQFFQLNTLQSLEQAVVSTRAVMVSRDEVLITYTELVYAALDETQGIDVAQKAAAATQLETQINDLKAHRERTLSTTDRAGIAERVSEFAVLYGPLESRIYTTRALIALGELQTVYDKNVILFDEIREFHASKQVSALKQQERERAYREVEKLLETTAAALAEVREDIRTAKGIDRNYFENSLTKELNGVYAQDSQLTEYMRELVLELS